MKLHTAVVFDGHSIDEITLDTSVLTAGALIDAETRLRKELRVVGEVLIDAENDPRYQRLLLALCCQQPTEMLDKMAAPDYLALIDELQRFLYSSRLGASPASAE